MSPFSSVPILYLEELTFGGLKVAIVAIELNHEHAHARQSVCRLTDWLKICQTGEQGTRLAGLGEHYDISMAMACFVDGHIIGFQDRPTVWSHKSSLRIQIRLSSISPERLYACRG